MDYKKSKNAITVTIAVAILLNIISLTASTFTNDIWLFLFSFIDMFICCFLFFNSLIIINDNEEMKDMAFKDELTNIYNRRKLDLDLENNFFKYGIMLDIDDFKKINDLYGHHEGDLCLKKISELILKYCSDEFKFYRYGGEEFFIASRYSYEATTSKLISIIEDVRENFIINNSYVTISGGMAENKDNNDCIREADAYLYLAKHNGKNQIMFETNQIV